MAVMQPRENVCISTQIENITGFLFVCYPVCVSVGACICYLITTGLFMTCRLSGDQTLVLIRKDLFSLVLDDVRMNVLIVFMLKLD